MPAHEDIISRMWELTNSLSEDARKSALKKCKELEFDTTKGDVPLKEAFINLDYAVSLLREGIEKQKLVQLPISIQRKFLADLESVSQFLANLNIGSDEIINLVDSIERLNSSVWQYGLHNLSKEVLGYQTKMNQLKTEETLLQSMKEDLQEGLALKSKLQNLLGNIEKRNFDSKESFTEISESVVKVAAKTEEVTAISQDAAAKLAAINQNQETASKNSAAAVASAADIEAHRTEIKAFFGEIEEYRTEIESVSLEARGNLVSHNEENKKLIETLRNLESQIKDQIERATGFSLFHSFQTRQAELQKSKNFWTLALLAIVIASVALSLTVILTTDKFDVAFYMKLTMSLPLIFALSFCAIQFSRERRLEEEYAFKGAISISLDPYRELVSKLVDGSDPAEKAKFAEFIVSSIDKVFASPTEKVFKTKSSKALTEKSLKKVAEIIGSLAKASRP